MNASSPALRVAGLCGVAATLMASYAVARPATESLFLERWTSDGLPVAWLAVAVAAVVVVGVYNRYAASAPLPRLFGASVGVSTVVFLLVQAVLHLDPNAGSLLLYVWKDVHIVVLVEIFWSYANSTTVLKSARWQYGIFCVFGSLGGIAGNLLVGPVAAMWGTEMVLWLVLPLQLLGVGLVFALGDSGGGEARSSPRATLADGLRVLRESAYLTKLLWLIATVQIVITLIDFAYNAALETAYPDMDARTQVIGWVYATVDGASMVLQLLTGPVLRLLGVPLVLLGVPMLLATGVGGYLLVPVFASMGAAKVASKALDYSLFRAAKEMLYIPLNYAEKTQGKGFVDIMSYRVAKGGASLLLIGLVSIGISDWVSALALGGILVWGVLTLGIVRAWRAATADETDVT